MEKRDLTFEPDTKRLREAYLTWQEPLLQTREMGLLFSRKVGDDARLDTSL